MGEHSGGSSIFDSHSSLLAQKLLACMVVCLLLHNSGSGWLSRGFSGLRVKPCRHFAQSVDFLAKPSSVANPFMHLDTPTEVCGDRNDVAQRGSGRYASGADANLRQRTGFTDPDSDPDGHRCCAFHLLPMDNFQK